MTFKETACAHVHAHFPAYKQTDRKYAFHLGGTRAKGTSRKNDGTPRKKHKFNLKNGCKRTLVVFVSECTKTSRIWRPNINYGLNSYDMGHLNMVFKNNNNK